MLIALARAIGALGVQCREIDVPLPVCSRQMSSMRLGGS